MFYIEGSYGGTRKDTYFRSIILALLAFLTLYIGLYLALHFGDTKERLILKKTYGESKTDKLVANNVLAERGDKKSTTTRSVLIRPRRSNDEIMTEGTTTAFDTVTEDRSTYTFVPSDEPNYEAKQKTHKAIKSPVILSPSDIILSNSNHSLYCQGSQPLKWTTPKIRGTARSWTIFDQQPEKPISKNYQYGSRLNIINMTFPFEGNYSCLHTSAVPSFFPEGIDTVFLYVVVRTRIIDNPKILPSHDDAIQSNSNHTVFCQGMKPLNWTTPEITVDWALSWTKFSILSENPVDRHYLYGSRLTIINMTYPFGGFYYCHHEDADKNSKYSSNVQLLVAPSPTMKKPQILSQYETLIENNGNYSVLCQGTKPLKWSIPEVPPPYPDGSKMEWLQEMKNFTRFIHESESPTSDGYVYGSRLHIINMTYPFVGFYYCHHEEVDKNSAFESSSIYLYVNDTDHLFTLATLTKLIRIINYDSIPCRPTSPYIHVELYLGFSNEDKGFVYDPKFGFTTTWSEIIDYRKYHCVFTLKSKVVRVDFKAFEGPVVLLRSTKIQDRNEGHTVVGEPLLLTCSVRSWRVVQFNWTSPLGSIDNSRMKMGRILSTIVNINTKLQQQTLVVYNTTLDDKGRYSCIASKMGIDSVVSYLNVNIFGVDKYFLNISRNNISTVKAVKGQPYAQFRVNIQGHPKPTVSWWRSNTLMVEDEKYGVDFDGRNNVASLTIKNISIADGGPYTFQASNSKREETLNFDLEVLNNPTVRINRVRSVVLFNTPINVTCTEYAYPPVKMEWTYKILLNNSYTFMPIEAISVKKEEFEYVSQVTINVSHYGVITCSASNSVGDDSSSTQIHPSDVKDGFDIFGLDSTIDLNEENMVATIAVNESIAVTCGVSIAFVVSPEWSYKGRPLKNNGRYKITESRTEYSKRTTLEISHANYSDSGLYTCRQKQVFFYGTQYFSELSIRFIVIDPQLPSIFFTNMIKQKEINMGDQLEMICNASGFPKPNVSWYKNGALFNPSEPKRIQVQSKNESIRFLYTRVSDEGTYKCVAKNKFGHDFREQSIRFKNVPRYLDWLIYGIIFVILLFVGVILIIIWKIRRERQLQIRELKKLGLANFLKGGVEHINPELGIGDQAEFLPYDQKWEFPIYNLKLGKELGSGEFGKVMIGQAKNIVKDEKLTTVAVKVVKKSADPSCIKALASELKIMIHLGKHLNVVNLLGACTRNIARRELLVIVEYCRFGNLQNYLLTHRDNFTDQVNPETGEIEYTTNQEDSDNTSVSYVVSNSCSIPSVNNMEDSRENAQTKTAEVPSSVSQDGDSIINKSGTESSSIMSQSVCTRDLLVWLFQLAKGMEFLASRKVLHGDLAARNVLLADDNIIKICDFGLAKSIYKYGKYKKLSDGPLPVKWMAIESIKDGIFSTQSDVWSFGIVLWEFFSLGGIPYPGIEVDGNFCKNLEDGYRMEAPKYAPKRIYAMMTSCWAPYPHDRPSFTELVEEIGGLLEATVRNHYIDLNNPYQLQNYQRLEAGEDDYLRIFQSTSEILSSPRDVDESTGQVPLEVSGSTHVKSRENLIPAEDETKV